MNFAAGVHAFRYQWSGHRLYSDIEFPELAPWEAREDSDGAFDDVRVRVHTLLAATFSNDVVEEPVYRDDDGKIRLRMMGLGEIRIDRSGEIDIYRIHGADLGSIRAAVLGPALGAFCYLRGYLAMQACAIRSPVGGALFMGPSGIGKSTLAAALGRNRFPIYADDLTVLTPRDGHAFVVGATQPTLKLYSSDWSSWDRETRVGFAEIGARGRKSILKWNDVAVPPPRRVNQIYVLRRVETRRGISKNELKGASALEAIVEHAYRPHYAGCVGAGPDHLTRCIRLLEQCRVYELHYGSGVVALESLLEQLKRDWEQVNVWENRSATRHPPERGQNGERTQARV